MYEHIPEDRYRPIGQVKQELTDVPEQVKHVG